jgi:hypothetical protein
VPRGETYAALAVISALPIFSPLLAILERLLPYRRDWNRSHGDVVADALHLGVTGPVAQGLVRGLVLGPLAMLSATVAGAVFRRAGHDLHLESPAMPNVSRKKQKERQERRPTQRLDLGPDLSSHRR